MSAPELAHGIDAPALAALHARAFAKPWSAADIAKLIEAPGAIPLLIRDQGFVLAWSHGDEAEILTLAVDPDHRRKGVGAMLLHAVMAAAAARGARAVLLEVGESNDAARALYQRAGFEQVGRRRGYYAGGEADTDAFVLRRTLA